MKTETLLLLGVVGVVGWELYQRAQAASSGLEPVTVTPPHTLSGLGDAPDPGGWGWRQRRARRMGVSPGQYQSIEYGAPPWASVGPGWAPYSPSAAFGPSAVEMETPGSVAFLASEIDAGNF
jgi:hypothetical protein